MNRLEREYFHEKKKITIIIINRIIYANDVKEKRSSK